MVGTPWVLGGIDIAVAGGLDCLGVMVHAYAVIGRHFQEDSAWRFPIPLSYPYDQELPDGSWLPADDLAEWSQHFEPVLEPVFGCAATFNVDHIGILIEPIRGVGFDVLHGHRTTGAVIHPLSRLEQWGSGFYVLKSAAVQAEARASA